MVSDAVAERLEEAGLWRRAAARWLDVMQHCDTEAQREWVSQCCIGKNRYQSA